MNRDGVLPLYLVILDIFFSIRMFPASCTYFVRFVAKSVFKQTQIVIVF